MGLPVAKKLYTPHEYYALERAAEYKSDFYKGEIFAMAGGTIRHSLICTNIAGELRNRLKGKPCRAFESNLRLKNKFSGLRTYPDVSVYCEPFEKDDEDPSGETVTNPTVLFEVLSPSTELYDRGFKAPDYRKITSLNAYVLVSQDSPLVEVYERHGSQNWLLSEQADLKTAIAIESIGIEVPLGEIYDGVDFAVGE